jgi:hypothetical protein
MNKKTKQNKEVLDHNDITCKFERKTVVEDEMENMTRPYTKKEEKMIKDFLKNKKKKVKNET